MVLESDVSTHLPCIHIGTHSHTCAQCTSMSTYMRAVYTDTPHKDAWAPTCEYTMHLSTLMQTFVCDSINTSTHTHMCNTHGCVHRHLHTSAHLNTSRYSHTYPCKAHPHKCTLTRAQIHRQTYSLTCTFTSAHTHLRHLCTHAYIKHTHLCIAHGCTSSHACVHAEERLAPFLTAGWWMLNCSTEATSAGVAGHPCGPCHKA